MIGLLVLFFAAAFASFEDWEAWKSEHGRFYATADEHDKRFEIFEKNLNFVKSHDADAKGFTVAMNAYGDLSTCEFKMMMNGLNITRTPQKHFPVDNKQRPMADIVDWRTKGAVTGVKNQGQCGSCWSFSATGSMEGAHKIATGSLVSLSEQNLVDCSVPEGNMGCNGGLMDQAFDYVIKNRGIDTEASYPYQAQGPLTCRFKSGNVATRITSYFDVPSGSESALQTAVTRTPTSVAIDASHQSFQFYSGGIYYEPACSASRLDHGVLAVGYGSEGSRNYWIVKNSWGTGWGMRGYINMSKDRNNNCGIATAASYPTGASN